MEDKNFKFDIGETVYVTGNGFTGLVKGRTIGSMGHRVYFLDTVDFDENYPFFENDLSSVDKELEKQNYSNYVDALPEKFRFSLLEPGFIEEMMGVMEFGALKYSEGDWVNSTGERDCVDAAIRHILEYKKGADFDVESGLSHFSHAATRLMMAYYHMVKGRKK